MGEGKGGGEGGEGKVKGKRRGMESNTLRNSFIICYNLKGIWEFGLVHNETENCHYGKHSFEFKRIHKTISPYYIVEFQNYRRYLFFCSISAKL